MSLNLLFSKDYILWRTQPISKPAETSLGSLRPHRASSVCGDVHNFTTTVPKNLSRSLAYLIASRIPFSASSCKTPCMSVCRASPTRDLSHPDGDCSKIRKDTVQLYGFRSRFGLLAPCLGHLGGYIHSLGETLGLALPLIQCGGTSGRCVVWRSSQKFATF